MSHRNNDAKICDNNRLGHKISSVKQRHVKKSRTAESVNVSGRTVVGIHRNLQECPRPLSFPLQLHVREGKVVAASPIPIVKPYWRAQQARKLPDPRNFVVANTAALSCSHASIGIRELRGRKTAGMQPLPWREIASFVC